MRRLFDLKVLTLVLSVPALSFAQTPKTPEKASAVQGYVAKRVLEPGPNLVTQNLPAIPLELVEAVKKYTETKGVFASQWHPTKREILIGKRAGNVTQIHLLTT